MDRQKMHGMLIAGMVLIAATAGFAVLWVSHQQYEEAVAEAAQPIRERVGDGEAVSYPEVDDLAQPQPAAALQRFPASPPPPVPVSAEPRLPAIGF